MVLRMIAPYALFRKGDATWRPLYDVRSLLKQVHPTTATTTNWIDLSNLIVF